MVDGSIRGSRRQFDAPAWGIGAVLGAGVAPMMAGPTLYRTSRGLKAAGAALTAAGALGVGTVSAAAVHRLAGDEHRLHAFGAIAGVGAALLGAAAIATRARGVQSLRLAETAGIMLAATGGSGLVVELAVDAAPDGATVPAVGAVAAAAGGIALLAARRDARLGAVAGLIDDLPELQRASAGIGALADAKPFNSRGLLTSGGADSLLAWEATPGKGRRFLGEMPTAAEIDRVMGRSGALEPIRVYSGLAHAPDHLRGDAALAARVRTAADELERLGAFGRFDVDDGGRIVMVEPPRASVHVVASIASGYVNPVTSSSHEFMALGDVATVTMQTGTRQAALELHRLGRGARAHRMLVDEVRRRIDAIPELPDLRRPRLVVSGESFGAWAGQRAFGTSIEAGLRAAGVDHALWIGTPGMSRESADLMRRTRDGVESLGELADVRAAAMSGRPIPLATTYQHAADPMSHVAPGVLVRRPSFLPTNADRARGVSPRQRFVPGATGVATALDVFSSQYYTKGVFRQGGHDYRAEITYAMRRAFAHEGVTDAHVARIREWNRQVELAHAAQQGHAPLP